MNIFAKVLSTLGVGRVEVGGDEITAVGPLTDREFLVPNMVCEGCAEKITEALTYIPGVLDVRPKVPQKHIWIRYEPDKVREQQLKDALRKIGFTALDA